MTEGAADPHWWDGLEPVKLLSFEWEQGKKHRWAGTLGLTSRVSLKDEKGPNQELGLYYHETLGRKVWLPLKVVGSISLTDAQLHHSGTGLIGFGPVGIGAAMAAGAVNRHRSRGSVQVLHVKIPSKQAEYIFHTKKHSKQRVMEAFGPLLNANHAEAAHHEAVRAAQAEEQRKREIQEQAAAIAAAVQPTVSVADELKKLADLHDAGVLTDEEFAAHKAKLLENS